MLPVWEYKNVADWLSVSVGMCAAHRLFSGCGELLCFICWKRKGRVRPSGSCVWKSSKDCVPGFMGYILLSSQGEGHGVAVFF